MWWPFVLLTIIALAIVLYTEYRDRSNVVGGIAKTVASLGFIGAAICAGAFDSLFGQTLFIALAWSFVGDVLLIARGSRTAFMFGIAAFLMGHLGYVMVFRLRGYDLTAMLVALAGFGVVAWLIWRWLSPHVVGGRGQLGSARPSGRGMRIAVGVYIAVITLMVAFAVGTTIATPAILPLAAAMLFWLSDLTVARQRFVERAFVNRAVGLPLYYAAQFLFVALI